MLQKAFYCLTLILLVSLSSANAQIEKGSHMVGGSFTGSFKDINDNLSFELSPTYGYFISNQIAVGSSLNLAYSHLKTTSFSSTTGNQTTHFNNSGFGIMPFVRYYPIRTWFAEAQIGYTLDRQEVDYGSSVQKSRQTLFSMAPALGYNYFIGRSVALEGKLSYTLTHRNSRPFEYKHFSKNLQLQIGLQVFLPSIKNKD